MLFTNVCRYHEIQKKDIDNTERRRQIKELKQAKAIIEYRKHMKQDAMYKQIEETSKSKR